VLSGAALFLHVSAMELILIILLFALPSIFWIWMLIDCILSSLPQFDKLVWLLVIFFTHIIGAILYFLLARNRGRI
jgi:hypothetical protein